LHDKVDRLQETLATRLDRLERVVSSRQIAE
jgi:hypothetical protein